jgi:hypothetical protein
VPDRPFSEAELQAAIETFTSDPERFRRAEERVATIVPQLQKILISVLHEGGYFDESHESQVLKAATTPDPEERITALRTLLADEIRMGMLIGVAVGWELGRELETRGDD